MKITADQVVSRVSRFAAPRGPKARLRALSAEGSGEVSRFALLKENDAHQEEADDDVKNELEE